MTQVARNITMADAGFLSDNRYVIRDRRDYAISRWTLANRYSLSEDPLETGRI